jgi:antirestriction protein ArdC
MDIGSTVNKKHYKFITDIGVVIFHTPEIPSRSHFVMGAYDTLEDVIVVKHPDQYDTINAYKAVLCHELIHWTGHRSRLNRESLYSYTMHEYYRAHEEIVAETGSIELCKYFGLDNPEWVYHSIKYQCDILNKYYRKGLEKPKNSLKLAEKDAEEAVDYILARLRGVS